MEWYKSVRAILAIFFGMGVHAALFTGNLTSEQYFQLATIVITAYFVKRSSDK
jgi:hypothetical protein